MYTVAAVEARQPDSAAQLRARDVLARASEAAGEELRDTERRLYWDTHAAEMGYKTAWGACVAHHARRLKEEMQKARTEGVKYGHKEVIDRVITKKVKPQRGAERQENNGRPTADEVMRMVAMVMHGIKAGRRRKRQDCHVSSRKRRHCVEA